MVQAVNSALDNMLSMDEDVLVFGEDVGYFGGVFRTTDGLQEKHGAHRVFDTPLSEGGIAAIAFGMGLNGLKPVCEIQFADYIFPAYDQIVNEIAKLSDTGQAGSFGRQLQSGRLPEAGSGEAIITPNHLNHSSHIPRV